MNKGFIKIRRGIEEHLVSGKIGVAEAGAYLIMLLQANFETGIWVGSAPRLLATAPRGKSLRDMQRAIERLAEIGFIRVFHEHGQRGNYRVLIHKYEPQFGALKGKRLNAVASTSWQKPTYESCAEVDAEADADVDAETVAEAAPIPEEDQEKKKSKKNPAAKTAPPADSRHKPFCDSFCRLYRERYGCTPTLVGKDFANLKDFLNRNPDVSQDKFERRYCYFRKSTDPIYQPRHGSLSFFVQHFNDFATGPILGRSSPNGSRSVKPSTTATVLEGYKQLEGKGEVD